MFFRQEGECICCSIAFGEVVHFEADKVSSFIKDGKRAEIADAEQVLDALSVSHWHYYNCLIFDYTNKYRAIWI